MDDGAELPAELPKLNKHFYFITLFCHFVVYVYVLFVCHTYVCYILCESLLLSITHTVVDLTFIMQITSTSLDKREGRAHAPGSTSGFYDTPKQ